MSQFPKFEVSYPRSFPRHRHLSAYVFVFRKKNIFTRIKPDFAETTADKAQRGEA